MKLWQKVSISLGAGLLLGIFLPLAGGDTLQFLTAVSELLISFGTYALIPLLFVQVTLASNDLAHNLQGRKFMIRSSLVLLASCLAFALLGGLVMLVLPIDRIPIIVEESSTKDIPAFMDMFHNLVTPNALQVLTGPVQYIPGLFLLALLLGLALHRQNNAAKPIVDLLEACSRVLMPLSRSFVEILVWGMTVLLSARIVAIRETPDIELFVRLFLILLGLGLFIVLAVFPLTLRLLGMPGKPFQWLRHSLSPISFSLSTGNNYLALAAQMQVGHDKFRYHRFVWGWLHPLSSIIGRAGTALVTSVAFILILRSYSSLEISVLQFLFIIVSSVLVSLVVSAIPNGRILIGLALLSAWFGQGIEEGYLILQPVAPLLMSFAVILDVFNQSFMAHLLTSWSRKDNDGIEHVRASKLEDEFNIN